MKYFLAIFTVLFITSCNSVPDLHDHTADADTSTSASRRASTASAPNEMKQLMDGMMKAMHGQKPSGNNDIDFAAMMLVHHQGAVDMANLVLSAGSDTALKNFSKQLLIDQGEEIAVMKKFIQDHPKTPSASAADFQEALNGSMMVMMMNPPAVYNNADKDFAAQMVPHHQSAVEMAKVYIQYGKDTVLQKLSRDIITAQEKEINWLRTWLAGK